MSRLLSLRQSLQRMSCNHTGDHSTLKIRKVRHRRKLPTGPNEFEEVELLSDEEYEKALKELFEEPEQEEDTDFISYEEEIEEYAEDPVTEMVRQQLMEVQGLD